MSCSVSPVPASESPYCPHYDRRAIQSPKVMYRAYDDRDTHPCAIDLHCEEVIESFVHDALVSIKQNQEKTAAQLLADTQEVCCKGLAFMQEWQVREEEITPFKQKLEEIQKELAANKASTSTKQQVEKLITDARTRVIAKTIRIAHAALSAIAPIFHGILPESTFFILTGTIATLSREQIMRTVIDQQEQNVDSTQMKAILALVKNEKLLTRERAARSFFAERQNALFQARRTNEPINDLVAHFSEEKSKLVKVWQEIATQYPSLKTLLPKPTTTIPPSQTSQILIPLNNPDTWAVDLLTLFMQKAPPLSLTDLCRIFKRGSIAQGANELPLIVRQFFSRKLASFIKTVYEKCDDTTTTAELGLRHGEKELCLTAFSYFGGTENPLMLADAIDHLFFQQPDWILYKDYFTHQVLLKSIHDIIKQLLPLQHIDSLALRGAFAISSEKIPDEAIPLFKEKRVFSLFLHNDIQALIQGSGKTLSAEDIKTLEEHENDVQAAAKACNEQEQCCCDLLAPYYKVGIAAATQLRPVIVAIQEFIELAQRAETVFIVCSRTLQKMLTV